MHRIVRLFSPNSRCRIYVPSLQFRSSALALPVMSTDTLFDSYLLEISVIRGWTKREFSAVRDKLRKVDLCSVEDVRLRLLRGTLNDALRSEGLTPFQSSTIELMQSVLSDMDEFHAAIEDARVVLSAMNLTVRSPRPDDAIHSAQWSRDILAKFQRGRIVSCTAFLRAFAMGAEAVNSCLEPPVLFVKTLETIQQVILRRRSNSSSSSSAVSPSTSLVSSLSPPKAAAAAASDTAARSSAHIDQNTAPVPLVYVFVYDGLQNPLAAGMAGLEFASHSVAVLPSHRLEWSWPRPSSFTRDAPKRLWLFPHVEPAPESRVHGVLYQVHPLQLPVLDSHYSVPQGYGRRCRVVVTLADGSVIPAVMFVNNNNQAGDEVVSRPSSRTSNNNVRSPSRPTSAVARAQTPVPDVHSRMWMNCTFHNGRPLVSSYPTQPQITHAQMLDWMMDRSRCVFLLDMDLARDSDWLRQAKRIVAASCPSMQLAGYIVEFDRWVLREKLESLFQRRQSDIDRFTLVDCCALDYGSLLEVCISLTEPRMMRLLSRDSSQVVDMHAGSILLGRHSGRDVEYVVGNLPIIFSVPHGGSVVPAEIADRSGDGVVNTSDSYTIELAVDILQELSYLDHVDGYRRSPHVVVCNLRRSKVDMNRDGLPATCGNPRATIAWEDYHTLLDDACRAAVRQFGFALLIDLHGLNAKYPVTQLGYLLSLDHLEKGELIASKSSFAAVAKRKLTFAQCVDLIFGESSLGSLMCKHGIECGPSSSFPNPASAPDQRYFSGHYDIRKHCSLTPGCEGVDAVQIETVNHIRRTPQKRKAFAAALSSALREFILIHYGKSL